MIHTRIAANDPSFFPQKAKPFETEVCFDCAGKGIDYLDIHFCETCMGTGQVIMSFSNDPVSEQYFDSLHIPF